MTKADHRDLVIDMLADSEAELRELVRAYRELSQAAFHRLAEKQNQIDRQHETICQLRAELRERMGVVGRGWAA